MPVASERETEEKHMKLDIIDIQNEDEEYPESEMPYTDIRRLKKRQRRKRRRRNRISVVLALIGCLALLSAVLYLGVVILQQAGETEESMEVLADISEVTYTQEELDARIQEALLSQPQEDKAQEVLDGIRQSLENGVSAVETLREFYPDKLVLVSGGRYHFVPINDALKKNSYDESCLNRLESGELQYMENEQVVSYKGIDVSSHQGDIDWQQVAEDGVQFAFIRAVYRGYGSGKLVEDAKFEDNIRGALEAGIKVGVYCYSQAVNEEEALEEANLVLQKIAPYEIACPVVFDVEMVSGADGRMNGLTAEERTGLVRLFCETVKGAGYKPMIYHNMEMATLRLQFESLEDYDKWFAYYNDNFYFPYEYDVWQYSEKGRVNGIKGKVDLNISFVPLWE